ncbi:MAG TPA: GNAT family N-acetyltransferase [Blastocatellia bacterium]|nr:GNAT family N-acetyltransferase [Blastocatellia bacterium]
MYASTLPEENSATALSRYSYPAGHTTVHRLTDEDRDNVLRFLAARPAHTFGLAGFVRDNGLVSPHNRGTFYACRNPEGGLEGVALIGHFIVFEARSAEIIAAFARVAQQCVDAFLLIGEQEKVQAFWHDYAPGGQAVRLYGRELLMEMKSPAEVREAVPGLRLATMADLDVIVPAHAECGVIESGIDPLESDAEGFRARCARRIEMGKTWVWIEDGRLMFKVDVVSETPDVIYLEGVWVHSEERGKGYGSRCLSQLGREFLRRTGSVCILVNEKFKAAQMLYRKVGFTFISYYDTIFLKQKAH